MTYNQSPSYHHGPNHNGLYFIVGGLLVLAVIVGAFIFNANRAENTPYEPVSGYATSTTDTNSAVPGAAGNNQAPADTTTTMTDAPEQAPLAP